MADLFDDVELDITGEYDAGREQGRRDCHDKPAAEFNEALEQGRTAGADAGRKLAMIFGLSSALLDAFSDSEQRSAGGSSQLAVSWVQEARRRAGEQVSRLVAGKYKRGEAMSGTTQEASSCCGGGCCFSQENNEPIEKSGCCSDKQTGDGEEFRLLVGDDEILPIARTLTRAARALKKSPPNNETATLVALDGPFGSYWRLLDDYVSAGSTTESITDW